MMGGGGNRALGIRSFRQQIKTRYFVAHVDVPNDIGRNDRQLTRAVFSRPSAMWEILKTLGGSL